MEFIFEVEVRRTGAGFLLSELHQRAKAGAEFVQGVFQRIVIRFGPVVVGLGGANQILFGFDEIDRKREFADLFDDGLFEGFGLFLFFAQPGE